MEGDDDKGVVEQLLESVDTLWPGKVYVGVAGDRDKVLRKLKEHPDWYGSWTETCGTTMRSTRRSGTCPTSR